MRRRQFIAGLGGAAAWSVVAWAQQADRAQRIGVLMQLDENDPLSKSILSAFTRALADLGWTVDRNVRMDLRWAGGDIDRMRALAQELVGLQPDIIVPYGTPATAAVRGETRTIPIVFASVADPVASGIIERLDRPNENITASQSWNRRWEENGSSCSLRSRLGSTGSQSCSILTRPPHRFICPHSRRRPGHSRS
jgi:putative tryptophan/tyrosine transport system substrate-binding protein